MDEDDGVLLIVVLDGFSQTSYLSFLDAKNLGELGRAECRRVVELGFRGQYVKAAKADGP